MGKVYLSINFHLENISGEDVILMHRIENPASCVLYKDLRICIAGKLIFYYMVEEVIYYSKHDCPTS